MPSTTALFDSTDFELAALIDLMASGSLQLPEFQRDLVWNLRKRLRLLQSLEKGFPTGTLLLMEVEGDPPFGYRAIRHLEGLAHANPKYLALDGQQRLTSLALAFISQQASANTCFFDLKRLHSLGRGPDEINLEEDRVVQVLKNRASRSPMSALLNDNLLYAPWILDGNTRRDALSQLKDKVRGSEVAFHNFLDTKLEAYVEPFARYKFPAVIIKKHASLEVVSTIFTEINTQAQKLSAFDLCVAKFYRQSQGAYSLRNTLDAAKAEDPNLTYVDQDGSNFLQTVALLSDVGNKKAALPDNLQYANLQTHGTNAFRGLTVASTVLQAVAQVRRWGELPYDAIVPPLALAMMEYPARVADRPLVQARVAKWFFAAALKRRYTEGTDVVQNEDKRTVVPWVLGRAADAPAFVTEPWAVNAEVRNGSAASSRGKALMLALRINGFEDPLLEDQEWDSHHIFPLAYLLSQGISRTDANRFLNRTWLTKATNRSIGSRSPSDYIPNALIPGLAAKFQLTPTDAEDKLKDILRGHFIDEAAYAALLSDQYEVFIAKRAVAFAEFMKNRFDIPYSLAEQSDPDAPVEEGVEDDEEL